MGFGRGRGGADCCFKLTVGLTCLALVIVAVVLIAVSFAQLGPNEYGLEYDAVSQTLNSRVYQGGTYFLGVGHSFITYPRQQQTVMYASTPVTPTGGGNQVAGSDGPAVACRTNDGLPVLISFAFNYQLIGTGDILTNLYLRYGDNTAVTELYRRIARNVVRTVTGKYSTFDLFTNRAQMQADMQASLNVDISAQGGVVQSFQFLDVGIPANFADARTQQASAVQAVTNAQNQLVVAQITAQTQVQYATQQAQLIVSQATNNASAAIIANNAAIASLTARYTNERAAYRGLRAALNMTTAELLSYIFLDAQAQSLANPEISSIVNLPMPRQLANSAP